MGLGEIRLGEMGLDEMGLGEMGQNQNLKLLLFLIKPSFSSSEADKDVINYTSTTSFKTTTKIDSLHNQDQDCCRCNEP